MQKAHAGQERVSAFWGWSWGGCGCAHLDAPALTTGLEGRLKRSELKLGEVEDVWFLRLCLEPNKTLVMLYCKTVFCLHLSCTTVCGAG